MDNRFSFASVILSYFLVGGGMFTATLVGTQLQPSSEYTGYALLAAGAFVGGFVAARASRGQTILEPALGALAVIATIAGLAATTPLGKLIWLVASDATMKFVGAIGVTGAVGAIVGAFISEKAFGEATESSVPWLLYSALSVFGACLLTLLLASIFVLGNNETTLDVAKVLLGIGSGCILAGLAIGASARTRPLFASFLGGGLGVAGFALLLFTAGRREPTSDDAIHAAIFAATGGAVTLIGTLLGWAIVGRRQAT